MSEQQKTGRNVACAVCGKEVYKSGFWIKPGKNYFCSAEHARWHLKKTRQKVSNCTVCAKEMTGDDLRQFWGKCGRDKHGKIHGMCRACKARTDEERRRKAEEEKKDRRDRIFKTRGDNCANCGNFAIVNGMSKWCKDCAVANPTEHKKQIHKEMHRRCMADPKKRLELTMRVRLGECLRGEKRGRRTFALLGFTVEQLRAHLEKQFLPGMTWENRGRGGWHIDHIIPLSAFNFETAEDIDFKRAWALSNLRPLWEMDNWKKNDTVESPFQPSLLMEAM